MLRRDECGSACRLMSQAGMIFEVSHLKNAAYMWGNPSSGNADMKHQLSALGNQHPSIHPRPSPAYPLHCRFRRNKIWSSCVVLRGAKSRRRRDAPYASKLVVLKPDHMDHIILFGRSSYEHISGNRTFYSLGV